MRWYIIGRPWYLCPNCGKRLLKYDELKGNSEEVYIKCKQCGKEVEVKIDKSH